MSRAAKTAVRKMIRWQDRQTATFDALHLVTPFRGTVTRRHLARQVKRMRRCGHIRAGGLSALVMLYGTSR